MSDPTDPTDGTSSDNDPDEIGPPPAGGGDAVGADGGPADGTPGWYLDRDDPALARWHDGDEWTEHTLVIADQPAGADPPPPPAIRRPSHAAILRERAAADAERKAGRDGLPKWAPIAVAVFVGLLAAGLFTFLKGDDDKTTTVDTKSVSIDEAVDAARTAGFPSQIGDSRASGLIEDLCEAADRPARTATLSADLTRLSLSPNVLDKAIGALGEGAKRYCPDERSGIIATVAQLRAQASGATTSTFPSVDGGVVDGSVSTLPGDGSVTSTTKKATTGTTTKPTGTTVAPTTTTTAPTTTTIEGELPNSSCSSEGATTVSKIDHTTPMTCSRSCSLPNSPKLTWRTSPCPPPVTQPGN